VQRVQEESVRFASGPLTLEGRAATPPGAARATIVCHPHPQYGGDMDSSVVTAVTQALAARGVATLRFNFRGVGASGARYDDGRGETDDARRAIAALRERTRGLPLTVCSHSFGSWVGLRAAALSGEVERVGAAGREEMTVMLELKEGAADAKVSQPLDEFKGFDWCTGCCISYGPAGQ
jgi:alpha/beta superfamily hydrolase